MTVTRETTTKRLKGMSTDDKPLLTQDDVGSEFLETNTNQLYYWQGFTWRKWMEVELHDGDYFPMVTPGSHKVWTVYMDIVDIVANTGFMVIDLSDIVNWPHTETGHIDLEYIHIHINPDNAFVGTVQIGFLSNVDGTDGDFHVIAAWDARRAAELIDDDISFSAGGRFHCEAAYHFGAIVLNDTTWQTDVNLIGPPGGAAAYPSGNGDVVLKIIRTAGTVNVDLLVGYQGEA